MSNIAAVTAANKSHSITQLTLKIHIITKGKQGPLGFVEKREELAREWPKMQLKKLMPPNKSLRVKL